MLKKIDCGCCMDLLKKASKWFWLLWGIGSIVYMLKGIFAEDADTRRHCAIMGMLYAVMFAVTGKDNKCKCDCKCGDGCECNNNDEGEE